MGFLLMSEQRKSQVHAVLRDAVIVHLVLRFIVGIMYLLADRTQAGLMQGTMHKLKA